MRKRSINISFEQLKEKAVTKRSFIARFVLKAAEYAFFTVAMFALTSVQASAQQ